MRHRRLGKLQIFDAAEVIERISLHGALFDPFGKKHSLGVVNAFKNLLTRNGTDDG
ncbi:hypothetical protein SCARR_05692 [Pontiella sulfatireligans]|uniref:Uncharacterized protein n=1 Tax=Pontiella sulfatireligans TaxID=2750658 RepID=A0A6C2UTD6_9BACT|nr:hypothetical protein SCARR_05692 [Pontiella sulfatireligans]